MKSKRSGRLLGRRDLQTWRLRWRELLKDIDDVCHKSLPPIVLLYYYLHWKLNVYSGISDLLGVADLSLLLQRVCEDIDRY